MCYHDKSKIPQKVYDNLRKNAKGYNVHIYDDHMDSLLKQTENELYDFPTLTIKNRYETLEEYTLDDFELTNYKHHPSIPMQMRV